VSKSERALATLTKAAAEASDRLTSCFSSADLLPPAIGRELCDVCEALDYLRFMLRSLTLKAAVHGEQAIARKDAG
jgi:hypothetical protein